MKNLIKNLPELEFLIQKSVRKIIAEQPSEAPSKEQKLFLNVSEASAFLNIAKQTLYTDTSKRKIPFFKTGKKLFFRQSDLELWVLEGEHKPINNIINHV